MKKDFSIYSVICTIALIMGSMGAQAADSTTFNQKAFMQAKKAGKTILVEFHAPWCPTCVKQAKNIGMLLESEFKDRKDLIHFKVDYDDTKQAAGIRKDAKVQGQSTLVLYDGEKLVASQRGETRPSGISAFIKKVSSF